MMMAGLYPHFMRGAVFWCEYKLSLPRNAESQSRVLRPSLFCQLFLDCKVKTVYHMQVIYNKVKEASAE